MEELNKYYIELSSLFLRADSLTQIIAIVSALGLIIALWAFVRSRTRGTAGHMNRVSSSVEDLRVKVADLASKSENLNVDILDELKRIDARVSGLEQHIAEVKELALSEGAKKKTNLDGKTALASGGLASAGLEGLLNRPSKLEQLEKSSQELKEISQDIAATAVVLPGVETGEGLKKTRSKLFSGLKGLVGERNSFSEQDLEAVEELMLGSDFGVQTSARLTSKVRDVVTNQGSCTLEGLKTALGSELKTILDAPVKGLEIQTDKKPFVVFVTGVNGVGKTTTIGKLATRYSNQGRKVLLAACDTFRAAAGEQLGVWAERSGVEIEQADGEEKPATVAFRSVNRAVNENFDVLLVDTAGRLHTKQNLMRELESVRAIISRECEGAPHETLLVVDGSTGQNALQQAKEFNSSVNLSGVVITKLDGTAKGGIVVAIKDELNVPIRLVGFGEGAGDLKDFDSEDFVSALLDDQGLELEASATTNDEKPSEHAKIRRKRRRQAL